MLHKQTPTFKTINYGQIVQVIKPGGYHSGMKVHFFNKKGVLIGNDYKFVSYDTLRADPNKINYELKYMGKRFEKVRQSFYEFKCKLTTILIRSTQSWKHK